ncbi:Tetrachloroethene reductive dehalogenase TceA [Dehalococcoides mccartyi]|uniref:Tetrachloroethene reductive dehalogenase TceA n=1 Tax=Dehalococcoides mccartyi TaxID=61435 RepID=A0A328EMZ7_9CHLR|nr:Tetrachloroethene reductive dehalogenase TceA [Dehalococcoides mccartyi]
MKGLGLAGAGLGVASSASPVFHDMDEVISSVTLRNCPGMSMSGRLKTSQLKWTGTRKSVMTNANSR